MAALEGPGGGTGPGSPTPRRPRRRGARILAAAIPALLAILLGLLGLAALITAEPGEPGLYPPRGAEGTGIALVSHGWHSGLVLPRAVLTGAGSGPALAAIATRFGAYPEIEFGWGEAQFYRATPTLAQFDSGLALRALFTPGGRAGVVQVVGLDRPARASFPHSEIVPVRVSQAGLARLLARLEASFRLAEGRPVAGGPGLYGPSLFYEGAGRFSYANVCNHWAARLLNAAGLAVTPVLDTHPAGLLLDLRWRAGLAPMPPAPGPPPAP